MTALIEAAPGISVIVDDPDNLAHWFSEYLKTEVDKQKKSEKSNPKTKETTPSQPSSDSNNPMPTDSEPELGDIFGSRLTADHAACVA